MRCLPNEFKRTKIILIKDYIQHKFIVCFCSSIYSLHFYLYSCIAVSLQIMIQKTILTNVVVLIFPPIGVKLFQGFCVLSSCQRKTSETFIYSITNAHSRLTTYKSTSTAIVKCIDANSGQVCQLSPINKTISLANVRTLTAETAAGKLE